MRSLAQALQQTLLWGLAFGVLGSCLGMTLGWLLPVYYQTVFSLREGIDPGPVVVGASVGGMQGFIGGVIWFLVLSLLQAWVERPPVGAQDTAGTANANEPMALRGWRSGVPVWFVWLAGGLAALSVTWVAGFAAGFRWGEQSFEYRQQVRLKGRLIQILKTGHHPEVTISGRSEIGLEGSVPDQAALAGLREELTREFGDSVAQSMLSRVRLASPPNAAGNP